MQRNKVLLKSVEIGRSIMTVGIYGDSEKELLLKKLCEDSFHDLEVICFSDKKKLAEQYLTGTIKAILLNSKYTMKKIKRDSLDLISLNIKKDDFFITPINTLNRYLYKGMLAEKQDIFVPIADFVQIHGLNVHVADHCNLRCKACSHSAPLVGKEVFPDIEIYKKDIVRLHEICPNICSIILLGGEPLLNPLLADYIRVSKKIYPDAGIIIITNGILLFQMSDELINCIKEYRVKVSVSIYPMMHDKADEYRTFLENKDINYQIEFCEKFEKKLVKESYFNGKRMSEWCQECVVLRNGMLSQCVMSMYMDYYNQYFHTNYPEHEGIDLYQQDLTGKKLMQLLDAPLKLCSYCAKGYQVEMVNCEQIKSRATEEDFVIR